MPELNSPFLPTLPGLTRRAATLAALCVWGVAVGGGLLFSFRFENTPGAIDVANEVWPAETACRLSARHPTLVMFVHPRCPCSRASLGELASLMTHCRGQVAAEVLFFVPSSAPADWARTDLWESAARIPGVVVRMDQGGAEQRHFASRVSGEVFVYRTDGRLAFHGGITSGRGHVGDNPGRTALEEFLVNGRLPFQTTPAFGCALQALPGPLNHGATRSERINP